MKFGSLIADGWSNWKRESFFALLLHFIDSFGNYHTIVIDVHSLLFSLALYLGRGYKEGKPKCRSPCFHSQTEYEALET